MPPLGSRYPMSNVGVYTTAGVAVAAIVSAEVRARRSAGEARKLAREERFYDSRLDAYRLVLKWATAAEQHVTESEPFTVPKGTKPTLYEAPLFQRGLLDAAGRLAREAKARD